MSRKFSNIITMIFLKYSITKNMSIITLYNIISVNFNPINFILYKKCLINGFFFLDVVLT